MLARNQSVMRDICCNRRDITEHALLLQAALFNCQENAVLTNSDKEIVTLKQ